ncbi:uncharacterized protein LOC135213673 [Macrobrachium nipponense]|uniref:uncharacterized protein LOC135213673 n=1 Tax=Macrobrachium nipponense TaxID=159736 RepID=UPI0030C81193
MVREREVESHQHEGVEGDLVRSASIRSFGRGKESGSILRQHYRSILYQESGRNPFILPQQSRRRSPSLVSRSGYFPRSEVCTGEVKCTGRRTQSSKPSSSHGVDIARQNLSGTVETLGKTFSGSVCHAEEQSTSDLLFPSSRSSCLEDRRNASGLDGSRRLRLSPIWNDQRGVEQVPLTSKCVNDVGSTILAQERVVSRPSQVGYRPSQTSSSVSSATQTAPLRQVSSEFVRSVTDRVQTVRKLVRAKGFSRRAAEAIANCRRSSSAKLYQSKWGVFRTWCRRHNFSSSKTSVTEIADFLLYLKEVKNLSVSTIKGYRAMLSSVFKHRGLDISSNQDIGDLIKSFNTVKVSKKDSVDWNLDVVLTFLMSSRFEPLREASLRDVTRKALFLFALATAGRVSELQAIHKEVGFKNRNAVCSFVNEFLAKNESPSNPWPKSFVLKGLSNIVGPMEEEEYLLCPVRALKCYLSRTQSVRGNSDRLWCSVKNSAKPSPRTLFRSF